METIDFDLKDLEAGGLPPLPAGRTGRTSRPGAILWWTVVGDGLPVVLVHGGQGNADQWGHQAAALAAQGYQVLLPDTRGHGRSTWDGSPLHYETFAADLEALWADSGLGPAPVVGWSDGACTALVLARRRPDLVTSVLFFGCNLNPGGTKPWGGMTPAITRCLALHEADYRRLAPDPGAFPALQQALGPMQASDLDWTEADLAEVRVPVTVVQGAHDEFIREDHARWTAAGLPRGEFRRLEGVSHFAPWQAPGLFNAELGRFLTVSNSALLGK